MKKLTIDTRLAEKISDGISITLLDDEGMILTTAWVTRYKIMDGMHFQYTLMMYNYNDEYIGLINFNSIEIDGKTASEVIE